jgi:hypothetical protein
MTRRAELKRDATRIMVYCNSFLDTAGTVCTGWLSLTLLYFSDGGSVDDECDGGNVGRLSNERFSSLRWFLSALFPALIPR